MLHTALAVGAGLVATAFACSTSERWITRHRRHELAWSVALVFFAIASFALAAGASLGWNEASFKVFYLFGAIVNVPFLALGTVYLLAGQRRGDLAAGAVALLAAFAAGVVVMAPLHAPLPADQLVQGREVFGVLPRVLAAVLSGVPALVIFGGAVWSAFRYRRGRMLWSNVLIAVGTVVLSSSGLFNSVLGEMDAFAVALTLGITVVFAGFLVATGATPTHAPETRRLRAVQTASPEQSAATSEGPVAATSRPSRAAAPRRT